MQRMTSRGLGPRQWRAAAVLVLAACGGNDSDAGAVALAASRSPSASTGASAHQDPTAADEQQPALESWIGGEDGPSPIAVYEAHVYWANITDDASVLRRRLVAGGKAETLAKIDGVVVSMLPYGPGMIFADIGGVSFIEKYGDPPLRSTEWADPVLELFTVAGHIVLRTTDRLHEVEQATSHPLSSESRAAVTGSEEWAYIGTDSGKLLRMRWDGSDTTEITRLPCRFNSLVLDGDVVYFAAGHDSARTQNSMGVGKIALADGETTWLRTGDAAHYLIARGDTLLFTSGDALLALPRTGGEARDVARRQGGFFAYAVSGDDVLLTEGPYGTQIFRARWQ
jgi:hypothetical protein